MRLCAFGDSYVAGTGDGDCQGWIGRVVARARRAGREITLYNLGIRGDTSEDIALRWAGEAARRLPPFAPMRLAFSFGANDCAPHGPAARVPLARNIENTESILRQALRMAPTIVIGPVPVLDDAQTDRRIQILSVAQERVCESLGVPFLPVFDFVRTCDVWCREAAAGDASHPDRGGYAALASFIAGWSDLAAWLS